MLAIKSLIRQSEAKSAALSCGLHEDNIFFLNMPFYQTGVIKKKPLSNDDIEIVTNLLEKVKPDQIYAAGDLTDPHGTHRTCLEAVLIAYNKLDNSGWKKNCNFLLYRYYFLLFSIIFYYFLLFSIIFYYFLLFSYDN